MSKEASSDKVGGRHARPYQAPRVIKSSSRSAHASIGPTPCADDGNFITLDPVKRTATGSSRLSTTASNFPSAIKQENHLDPNPKERKSRLRTPKLIFCPSPHARFGPPKNPKKGKITPKLLPPFPSTSQPPPQPQAPTTRTPLTGPHSTTHDSSPGPSSPAP